MLASTAHELASYPHARKPEMRERAFRRILRAAGKLLTDEQTQAIIDDLLRDADRSFAGSYPMDDGVNAIAAGIAVDLWGEAPAEGEE